MKGNKKPETLENTPYLLIFALTMDAEHSISD